MFLLDFQRKDCSNYPLTYRKWIAYERVCLKIKSVSINPKKYQPIVVRLHVFRTLIGLHCAPKDLQSLWYRIATLHYWLARAEQFIRHRLVAHWHFVIALLLYKHQKVDSMRHGDHVIRLLGHAGNPNRVTWQQGQTESWVWSFKDFSWSFTLDEEAFHPIFWCFHADRSRWECDYRTTVCTSHLFVEIQW